MLLAVVLVCGCAPGRPLGALVSDCERPGPDGSPAKQIRVEPEYPRRALRRGLQGYVSMRFDLDPAGAPGDIVIIDAQPPGVFDAAAVEALRQWRYCPSGEAREGIEVTLTFGVFH